MKKPPKWEIWLVSNTADTYADGRIPEDWAGGAVVAMLILELVVFLVIVTVFFFFYGLWSWLRSWGFFT